MAAGRESFRQANHLEGKDLSISCRESRRHFISRSEAGWPTAHIKGFSNGGCQGLNLRKNFATRL